MVSTWEQRTLYHICIFCLRQWGGVLECVSQCGRGTLLTWLTHLPWLTNIKRANHIKLLSTDSGVDLTQRVAWLFMLVDLQTELRTKHCCFGKSRPKEHHTVHCTSVSNIKEWNTQLNFIFSVWVIILHLMLWKNQFYKPAENHQDFVPSNPNSHLPDAWILNDGLNCVGDLPLWGCLLNEAAARCTMNVFASLMRARRGSWILVIWVRMRLAACHGRSSLITYALAHN